MASRQDAMSAAADADGNNKRKSGRDMNSKRDRESVEVMDDGCKAFSCVLVMGRSSKVEVQLPVIDASIAHHISKKYLKWFSYRFNRWFREPES